MTWCVIYAAKSTTDEQGSLPSQLAHCRDHAAQQGWQVAGEYQDEAASAYSGSRGPGLREAKRHAAALASEHGESVLLVFATDRLARGDGRMAAHLVEYVLEATKAGYRIESVTEDLGGQMALVLAALYGERAHADSEAKSAHTRAGKRRSAERGRRNGGPRPFGYRHVPRLIAGRATSCLEVVAEEAAVVRRVFEDYAAGKSQAEIARDLNTGRVLTVRGARWSQSRIGQMLRNPLYRGLVRHRSELFPGQHEALVSEELWRAAECRRSSATRQGAHAGGRPPSGSHLLTGGLLRCACGGAMRARTEPKQYGTWEAYLCDGRHSGRTRCTLPAIAREAIDKAVWHYFEAVGLDIETMVREYEDRRTLELAELADRICEQENELATATEQLERIRRDYKAGTLPASDWREFRDEIVDELNAAKAALDQLRHREQEVHSAAAIGDAQKEVLEELEAIRARLAGLITSATDLAAARQALQRVFASFTLHRYADSMPGVIDADLATGDWYIIPTVRADAILSPLLINHDLDGGDPIIESSEQLRRTSIATREKLRDSPR